MTDTEINIAIAELRGYKWVICNCGTRRILMHPSRINHCSVWTGDLKITPDEGFDFHLPRYTTSLDACAEFEAGLTDEEFRSYSEELCDLCGIGNPHYNPNLNYLEIRPLIQASALQRCEAFLRLKGKWVESTVPENKPETQAP